MWPFKSVPSDGIFRNPQSFTLLSTNHLLAKLKWDMDELEKLRWNEDLGNTWRQVVSYKVVDCATTIWHLAEWFEQDIRGTEPRDRACAFLGIKGHDTWSPIKLNKLRNAALAVCPDLEVSRVVAIASKHYEVNNKPRPDIRTAAYLSTAKRGSEPFQRPVMWIAVFENDVKRDMREILRNGQKFWEQLWHVAHPGSTWKPGDAIP